MCCCSVFTRGASPTKLAAEGDTVVIDYSLNYTTPVQNIRWFFQPTDPFDAGCIEITNASRLGNISLYNWLFFSMDGLTLTILNSRQPVGGLFYTIVTVNDTVFAELTELFTQRKSVNTSVASYNTSELVCIM